MRAVVLDGIVLGLAFGLLGVGMTLVYGLGGVLNLAYGQIVVLAAIVISLVMEDGVATVRGRSRRRAGGGRRRPPARPHADAAGLPPARRGADADGAPAHAGSRLRHRRSAVWRYPAGALYINIGGDPVSILGVPMAVGSIWASVIALAVAAVLLLFFGLTTFGRGVRSVIQDETGARLVGINPSFVRTVIFALSGALAGIVAITQSMSGPLDGQRGLRAHHLRADRHRRGRSRQRRRSVPRRRAPRES